VVEPLVTVAENVTRLPEHIVDGLAETFTVGDGEAVTVIVFEVNVQPLLLVTFTE
jgi:hypothetical protein